MSNRVKRNLTARAIIRAEALSLSHNAMVVLAVMATWADGREVHPVYFKDQGAVAARAKLSPRAVRNALTELERAGTIKRLGVSGGGFNRETGMVTRGTVRWGLILLEDIDDDAWSDPAPRADKSIDEPTSSDPAPRADKRPAPRADKRAAPRADNQGRSQSERSKSFDDDDSGSGTRPSADAPAGPAPSDAAAVPSPTETLLSRIVEITEWPAEQAAAWLVEFTERNKGRSGIASWPAYVIGSARKAVAAAESSAPAKPASKSKRGKPAKTAKPKRTVSPESIAKAQATRKANADAAQAAEAEAAERERAAGPAVGICATCETRGELALLGWPQSGIRGHGLCEGCLSRSRDREALLRQLGRASRCAACSRRYHGWRKGNLCPVCAEPPASVPVANRPTADPPPSTLDAQRATQRAGGAITAPSTVAPAQPLPRPTGPDPFGMARPVAPPPARVTVSYPWQQAVRGGKCPSCDSPAVVPVDGCGFYCEEHSR